MNKFGWIAYEVIAVGLSVLALALSTRNLLEDWDAF